MKRDTVSREYDAGGIIFRKEKNKIQYLLIKDQFNNWTIPKGHIESGENTKEAALREIAEETGLKNLEIVRDLGSTKYFFCQNKDLILKTVTLYLIEAEDTEKLNPDKKEVKSAMWFSGKDALKNVDYKNIRDMLNKAMVGGKTNEQ